MLEPESIDRVDRFGERLRDSLRAIGESGEWGASFRLSRPPGSDYDRAQVIVGGEPKNKNWVQLNGRTYSHPSYRSPIPWKLQARFASCPASPLWEKKPPYVHGRQPQEWSLGGLDVFAISYERLAQALSCNGDEVDVMEEILEDLEVSWAYANQQPLPCNSLSGERLADRVDITLSVKAAVWLQFQQAYAQFYRCRRKHAKRPSYAQLQNRAIDEALRDYVKRNKPAGETELPPT